MASRHALRPCSDRQPRQRRTNGAWRKWKIIDGQSARLRHYSQPSSRGRQMRPLQSSAALVLSMEATVWRWHCTKHASPLSSNASCRSFRRTHQRDASSLPYEITKTLRELRGAIWLSMRMASSGEAVTYLHFHLVLIKGMYCRSTSRLVVCPY
jgi:hypothetical protein